MSYKLLHKPTGLYFKSDPRDGDLDKEGYIYKEKPVIPHTIRVRFLISRSRLYSRNN